MDKRSLAWALDTIITALFSAMVLAAVNDDSFVSGNGKSQIRTLFSIIRNLIPYDATF